MIKELIDINENLIQKYKDDSKKLENQLLIQKLLKDNKCFFKIEIEVAYQILRDLEIKENNIRNIYCKLIDITNY